MGRHRLPDPDDPNGDDSATERLRFPFRPDPRDRPADEPSRHHRPDEVEPDYGQYEDARYQPDYDDSGYRPDYDAGGYPGYPESDFTDEDFTDEDFTDEDFADEYSERELDDVGEVAATGRRRSWDSGEWTGSHRAVAGKRRGVSVAVIAALVGVVVLVAGLIGWQFFGNALSDRSSTAAARCVDGEFSVPVLADPSIAEHTQELAGRYNETASPVGDKCVQVAVQAAEPSQVVDGFRDDWPTDLGERPALWIPASSASEARLEAVLGPQAIDDSRSLVTSPVLIAVRPELNDALAQQNWATLPQLQTNPESLDQLDLPGWGSLRLALPLRGDADASYLAAEAVAAAAAPAGQPASAGIGALNTLLAGQPELPDDTASTAMDALVNTDDPAGAPVHAVVTTEQQLYQRASSIPDAGDAVTSWMPPGPVPTADYPTVLLSGEWLTQEQVAAASEFARFMRRPEQLTDLADAGFRAEGMEPPQSDVVGFTPVAAPLAVDDPTVRVALADALTAPVASPAVTVMLDRSMTATEGTNTRMGNAVNALINRVEALPPTAAVGLWTFDGVAGNLAVSTGPLGDPVNGQPRSEVLPAVLDEQSSTGGGTVSFTTMRLVYLDATDNFREGQPNSVLVITGGPHTDRTLDGPGLQNFIEQTFDPARPVAVNVIDFGEDADRPTWEAVAETTGGAYLVLPTSDTPQLSEAITRFLG